MLIGNSQAIHAPVRGYPFVEKGITTKYCPVRGYPFAKGNP
jgi:hypothetical protein